MSSKPVPQLDPQARIVVGMSGGVDSSVSAYLLQQQGYDVLGLFMKNWEEDDTEEYCSATADLEDAEGVCEKLGLDLHTRNFAAEYWDNVFTYFLDEYRSGRTPNPDILCNREIKFKTFIEHAEMLGASHIATGHYARVRYENDHFRLYKAADLNKDQSYFLYALGQHQLARAVFPLGEISKPRVRELAAHIGLDNHAKKDSTGICFIGERRFKDFLARFLPAQPGEMRDPEGKLIGQHDGLMYYTLGQRQGLGIGGTQEGSEEPWYVVDKDLEHNVLIVAQGHDHPLLFKHHLRAQQLNWIADTPKDIPFRCMAKTRYRQPDQACTITRLDDEGCEVVFDAAQRAITPGQSVVFYTGDECLGGGVIQTAW